MTLQQMAYFTEVARVRHFTRAAENLFVAQSSLSHAIRALEQELGVPLFTRESGKGVDLTEFGRVFLMRAKAVLDMVERSRKEIEDMRKPLSGIVTVLYSYVNGRVLVPQVVNAFNDWNKNENISVQINVNHERRAIEEEVREGKADLAFTARIRSEGLNTMPVMEQELSFILPKSHPLAGRESIRLEEVADESLLIQNQGGNLHRWIEKMFEFRGLKLNVGACFAEWSEQITAVSLGQGIMIGQPLPVDPELVSLVRIDHPMNKRYVYMLWSSERKLSSAAEYVRSFCESYFLEKNGGPLPPKPWM